MRKNLFFFFNHESSQTLQQVAHRSCAVFRLGDFKDPPGQSPEQAGLVTQVDMLEQETEPEVPSKLGHFMIL